MFQIILFRNGATDLELAYCDFDQDQWFLILAETRNLKCHVTALHWYSARGIKGHLLLMQARDNLGCYERIQIQVKVQCHSESGCFDLDCDWGFTLACMVRFTDMMDS